MFKSYYFEAKDGKKINVSEWKPEEKEIKGIVQIIHGMVEHSKRYNDFANELTKNGYVVFADDHRAHGKTDEKNLGYSEGDIFENILSDEKELAENYKNKYKNAKLVIFAHSYGSFVAQLYIQRNPSLYDAIILSGSARNDDIPIYFGEKVAKLGYKIKGPKAKAKLLYNLTFDNYNKNLTEGNFVTSIEKERLKYDNDVFCSFICSYSFYKSFFEHLRKLYTKEGLECIDKNKMILIASGSHDAVGGYEKNVRKLYETYLKLGIKVKLKFFKNSRHDFLNDVEKEEAFNYIIKFINDCM